LQHLPKQAATYAAVCVAHRGAQQRNVLKELLEGRRSLVSIGSGALGRGRIRKAKAEVQYQYARKDAAFSGHWQWYWVLVTASPSIIPSHVTPPRQGEDDKKIEVLRERIRHHEYRYYVLDAPKSKTPTSTS